MKYKACQLLTGEWAVAAPGRKFFTGTTTSDKEEAEERALIMSAQWYRDQIDKIELALDDRGYFKRNDCNMGDLMC